MDTSELRRKFAAAFTTPEPGGYEAFTDYLGVTDQPDEPWWQGCAPGELDEESPDWWSG